MNDPVAKEYIEARQRVKKNYDMMWGLINFMMKLNIYPSVNVRIDINHKRYPMSHKHPNFKEFYKTRRSDG